MRETISQAYHAGIEIGRKAAMHEMAELDKITGVIAERGAASILASAPTDNGARKRPGRLPKAYAVHPDKPSAAKAPKVSRGVRIAKGPRAKGVKEAIMSYVAGGPNGATVGDIIKGLGFKENSVRATLMGLKKAGIANQDEYKRWTISAPGEQSGNSDHGHVDVGM